MRSPTVLLLVVLLLVALAIAVKSLRPRPARTRLAALRDRLRRRVPDDATVDRLVAHERMRRPGAREEELLVASLDRLAIDRRGR